MGQTLKGYANYGVLAQEKKVVFTGGNPHCHATVSDKIEIIVPDGFSVSENAFGTILINTPDGITYEVNEILNTRENEPVMSWFDGKKEHRVKCQWREIS